MDAGAIEIPYHGGKSCRTCNDGVVLTAVFANGRKGDHPSIPSWCIAAQHFFENLPIEEYGHHFGMSRSRKTARRSDYRINVRKRFEILERDGFACVYCREPATEQQINQIRTTYSTPVSSLPNPDGSPRLARVDEIETTTYFGHDADHLFTEADRALIKQQIDNDADEGICQRWTVTACGNCNNGRRSSPLAYRTMISRGGPG